MLFIRADDAGRITATVDAPDEDAVHYGDMVQWTGSGRITPYEHYILNGEVTERPASPVSRTGLTLLDVPAGSKLTINGESYDAEGTVELEFPLSGTYALRVECFPFLDWIDQVVVP